MAFASGNVEREIESQDLTKEEKGGQTDRSTTDSIVAVYRSRGKGNAERPEAKKGVEDACKETVEYGETNAHARIVALLFHIPRAQGEL